MASSTAGGHALNNTALWIGNNRVFGPRLFQGRLDEVAVFSRALTAAEIAALYETALAPLLTIAPQNHAVVLTWPTNFTGFVLQTNGFLPGSNWATLPTSYGILGTNFGVTNPLGAAPMFYRLSK